MAEVKKYTISPVMEHGHGFVFRAAGQNFKMTGNVIQEFKDVTPEFNALAKANEIFTINENGIQFYYDWNSKTQVTKVDESATKNLEKLFKLEEKLEALKETRKEFAIANKEVAVKEVEASILEMETKLAEVKRGPLAINFRYVAEERKFYMGAREIADAYVSDFGLTEHAFAMGAIKYEDKMLLNIFEFAGKNFDKFMRLEFLTESAEGVVKVLTMRTENNVFVYRLNESTKIASFEKMLADAAIDYVAEQTGADISFMVEDILEAYQLKALDRQKKIDTRYEMVSFLKDQKGRLAETNRNLPAIKAADLLLDEEINRITGEIETLEAEETLGRKDGFVTATINSKIDEFAEGTEVKVDALDYTSAGKEDILTVFINDAPVRLQKFKIDMPSSETV